MNKILSYDKNVKLRIQMSRIILHKKNIWTVNVFFKNDHVKIDNFYN